MAQTFGVDIKPIGVAKYTQETLKPLDSADLSRFFNMNLQMKQENQRENILKADILGKAGTLLKDLDFLPKDLPMIKGNLAPLEEKFTQVKSADDAIALQGELQKFMLAPEMRRALQEKRDYDKHLAWYEKNADYINPEKRKELFEDISLRANNSNQLMGQLDYSKYLGSKSMKEQLIESQIENANTNTEVNKLLKESQITKNQVDAEAKKNTLETHDYWKKLTEITDQDPNMTAAEKMAFKATVLDQKTPSNYKNAALDFYLGKYDNLRDAVSSHAGKFPPKGGGTGVSISTGDSDLDALLSNQDVLLKNRSTGADEPVANVRDPKTGTLTAGAKKAMVGENIWHLFNVNEDGSIIKFDPQTGNTAYPDVMGTRMPFLGYDGSTWDGIFSSISVEDKNTGAKLEDKTQTPREKILDKYGHQTIGIYGQKPGDDPSRKDKPYIVYAQGTNGEATPIYTQFVSQDKNPNDITQVGYLKTNNPKVVEKFYKEMVESGRKTPEWFYNNVSMTDMGNGIEYRIKNQVWNLYAGGVGENPDVIDKAVRLKMFGTPKTKAELEKDAAIEMKAANDLIAAGTYQSWDNPQGASSGTVSNIQVNRTLNRQSEDTAAILNKIRQIPGLSSGDPIKSWEGMDPELLREISTMVDLDNPTERDLLLAVTDVTDDHRDYASDHPLGRAIDLSVRPENIKRTKELLNRIQAGWPLKDDANKKERYFEILLEGPDQATAEAIGRTYGIEGKVRVGAGIPAHIHISFKKRPLGATRKSTPIDTQVLKSNVNSLDTSDMSQFKIE
jgi:hypothetical protein